jgi:hypothetical protein
VRYWILVIAGLAVIAASLVAVDWAIYHLARTGTCASGGPYVSARPCPAGTGGQIGVLIGGMFAVPIGIALWALRGRRGRPSAVGIGTVVWALGFLTIAASVAFAAYGPANTHNSGSRLAAIIIGVIFVPMGIAPLIFALRGGDTGLGVSGVSGVAVDPAWHPQASPPPRAAAPPPTATGPAGEDPLDRIARLGELRDKGLIDEAEFQEQKRRLLGEV